MARVCLALGVIALVGLSVRAQTAQLPPSSPRPDLSGTWTLDPDVGTELAKLTLIPSSNNNSNAARQPGGMRRGGGFGGRSFGGSRQRDQNSGPKLTSDEQAKLKAMAEVLKSGWAKLTIALHEPSFVINDSRDRTLFFSTDGNAVDNHVGELTMSTTTRWDGERLVTEWPIGPNLTLVYSYTLQANMKRLVFRIERKDGDSTRPLDPSVYLLYRRSS
jgi:hypothetical protein